jgi:hypothetical protein
MMIILLNADANISGTLIAFFILEGHLSSQFNQRRQTTMSRNPLNRPEFSKESSAKDFGDKIVDVTSKVKEKAGQMADKVSDTVDKTRDQAAEGLDRAASALHDNAEDIPGGPKVVSVAHTVADGMESAAQYLREANFEDMKEGLLETCRKYPGQTLLGALAIGFLVGRAVRR